MRPQKNEKAPVAATTEAGKAEAQNDQVKHFIGHSSPILYVFKWAHFALQYDPTTMAVWVIGAALILGQVP
nr:hypothetical protein [Dechloromonas sp.]